MQNQNKKIIRIIAFIIFVAAIIFLGATNRDFFRIFIKTAPATIAVSPITEYISDAAVPMTGTLLLSLLPNEQAGGMPLTMSFDLATGGFEGNGSVRPDFMSVHRESAYYPYHTGVSPDRKILVSLAIHTDFTQGKLDDATALLVTRFDTSAPFSSFGTVPFVAARFGANGTASVPRLPQVNNAGSIVYTSAPVGATDISLAWDIHLTVEGKDAVVAHGLYPHWIDTDRFVYLAQEGIMLYTVSARQSTILTDVHGRQGVIVPAANMMLGAAKDGTKLAITTPDEARVIVYSVSGNSVAVRNTIDVLGFWPTFSPDSTKLALQSVAYVERLGDGKSVPSQDAGPYIGFFDVSGEVVVPIKTYIPLSDFIQDLMFITDWY